MAQRKRYVGKNQNMLKEKKLTSPESLQVLWTGLSDKIMERASGVKARFSST